MYIESDKPFVPPVAPPAVTVTTLFEGAIAATPLEFEAFNRDRDLRTVNFKCYDSRGAIVWLSFPQSVVEEAVFGEM